MHYPNYPPKDNEQQQQQNQYFDIPELNVPPLLTSDQETRVPFYDLKEPLNTQTDQYLLPAQCDLEVQRPVGSCTDDYNCQCDSCQNKYGDLPILLQGIEQKNFNEKTDPQPSTSSQSSSKKILTCEYCRKTFTHKGDFNKHLRKHTKEKPFSCRICSRKFGHTSNLLRHQRLHSGEKPFACDNCDKRFSRKDKLDCHKRSRTCQVSNNAYQSYQ